jgi:hypothetical protein
MFEELSPTFDQFCEKIIEIGSSISSDKMRKIQTGSKDNFGLAPLLEESYLYNVLTSNVRLIAHGSEIIHAFHVFSPVSSSRKLRTSLDENSN